MEEDKKHKTHFPYKTLIWALFACITLFLFKTELKQLLTNAEKLSVFGVEINASKEKVTRLQDSIQSFETTIANLSNQISDQQDKINDLGELKTKLQKELEACPEAKQTSIQFNKQVSQILSANRDLQVNSNKLKQTNILSSNMFLVKLIVPSKMAKATVYIDGKKTAPVKRSGAVIAVKVPQKSSSHNFEIRQGDKTCNTDRLITKNNTELPMACDF
ncbi:hypothetical protein [Algibacter mikhailovii]|uniref:hypothetical protein n=1 Tax=Algibacter mikhailovii TaxID=425498 RepID=UPI002494E6AF|nr:hypothetical protein [Algibacter mikhailovii]